MSVRAEILKLTRQRGALFWGFLLVPAFTTFVSLVLVGSGPPPGTGMVEAIRPFQSAARSLAVGGNPIAQLFYAIGAAAIFAVDYRYSGWRHLVPRARRSSLLLAKLTAFALVAGLSLMLVALGNASVTLGVPLARGLRPAIVYGGAGAVGLSFLISWLELTVLAGLVALVAVASRSAMAAILVPFLLSLGATMAESWLSGSGGAAIPLPTFAADALRAWLVEAATSPATALATLLGWFAVSFGLAVAIFARQDLVSE